MKIHKYVFRDFLSRSVNDVDDLEFYQVTQELPHLGTHKAWIAGGAVRRTLRGDLLESDFDIFFKNGAFLDEFREDLKKRGGQLIHENNHQESYNFTVGKKTYIVQLLKIGFYETVEELLDTFDFTITQFAYDGLYLYCGEHSLWDLARNKLVLHRLTYGVATMRRMLKYTKQDFTACAGVMQSVLEAVVENPTAIQSHVQYID